jgi:hypothetical protein
MNCTLSHAPICVLAGASVEMGVRDGTPGSDVLVSRGVLLACEVRLTARVTVTLGVLLAASAVAAWATSTVCHIWVNASAGSVVGAPPPQAANPTRMKAIHSQVILLKRDIISSKTIVKPYNKISSKSNFIITESKFHQTVVKMELNNQPKAAQRNAGKDHVKKMPSNQKVTQIHLRILVYKIRGDDKSMPSPLMNKLKF